MVASESGERLRARCEAAARGSFPAPRWDVELVPAPPRLIGAVVAFTGHHVIAADLAEVAEVAAVGEEEVRRHLDPDDIAAPGNPVFLAWLGRRLRASVGHVDVTLARMGGGDGDEWLQPVLDPPDNERVRRSQAQRADVTFLIPPEGGAVVTVGLGLADRLELSVEISDEARRNAGFGTRLVRAAVGRLPVDEAVFASVAPGNTRSLRCLLHAGFTPIGSECLLTRPPL